MSRCFPVLSGLQCGMEALLAYALLLEGGSFCNCFSQVSTTRSEVLLLPEHAISHVCCAADGQQPQQQQQQPPGRHLLPVALWPCAKLARGVALVSSSVWSALVQPEQGAFLALYSLPQAAATGTDLQIYVGRRILPASTCMCLDYQYTNGQVTEVTVVTACTCT